MSLVPTLILMNTQQPPSVPHFTITDYPGTVTVTASQQFSIDVTVMNDGNAAGTVELRLIDHNNNTVGTRRVNIGAGETATVTLTATAPDMEGRYTWRIEAYNTDTGNIDDAKTVEIVVQQQQPPPQPSTKTEKSNVLPMLALLLLLILMLEESK